MDFLGRIYCLQHAASIRTEPTRVPDAIALTQGVHQRIGSKTPPLAITSRSIDIEVIEQGFRPFAKCNDYQLTTSRDTIDVTTLGEYFYKQYENGLIGGQGTVTAIWDEKSLTPGDNELR